jgi:hypothetical protein
VSEIILELAPRCRDFLRNKNFLEKDKFWLNMAVPTLFNRSKAEIGAVPTLINYREAVIGAVQTTILEKQ